MAGGTMLHPNTIVECMVFAGKRPGGKVIGKTRLRFAEIRGHGWEKPLIRKRYLNSGAVRYCCLVSPEPEGSDNPAETQDGR